MTQAVTQEQAQRDTSPAVIAHSESAPGSLRLRQWLERWRPAAPVLMLFAFGVGAVFGLTWFGGIGLDREAAQTSLEEMSTQVEERGTALGSVVHDYAWWDEAVENLVTRFSPDWAKANLGPKTVPASYPQIDGTLAIGADDRVLYGFLGAGEFTAGAALDLDGGLAALAAAARAGKDASPAPVHAAVRIGGKVYLAGAAAVSPFSHGAPSPQKSTVIVMLTALDAKTLEAICMTTRVDRLQVTQAIPAGEVGMALTGASGTILGYLSWIPPYPGRQLIDRLMLPILLVTLLLGALCLLALDQILRVRRAAESYAALVVTKNRSLQQAAGLLSLTIDSIDEGIVVMNQNGELRHWNKTYEGMWRFPPGGLKVGARLQDIIDWKMRQGGYEMVDADHNADEPAGPSLHPPLCRRLYRSSDGRLIEASRFAMPHGQGQIGVTRDLTEVKKRENALIEAREQAVVASRTKSEFLANVSHELRTPLNAVIGFAEVLEVELYGPIENERYRSYIRDIRKSGLHLLSLINDILDFSKMEAGKLELRLELCDCTAVARDAARQVEVLAQEQGLAFRLHLPETPLMVQADARALFRALLNLLSNAIKFTPSGGTVTLGYRPGDNGAAVFWVSDTGIGIAVQDIEKALTPFGQIDSDIARKYRGTGLGLSIVQGICELHGGSLDIVSEVGVGTTVTIVVPDQRTRTPRQKSVPRVAAPVAE